MDWQSNLKKRYATEGWEAFREADKAFKRRLERLCAKLGISIIDNNSEGRDWMILLKDGTELYVDRSSYDTEEGQIYFWVEYSPEHGGIVAEFLNARGKPAKHEVIVSNAEIADVCDKWR